MIDRVRRYTIITMVVVAAVAATIVRADEPEFPELMSNEQYTELKRQNDTLLELEDSIQRVITDTREEFSRSRDSLSTPIDIDKYTSYILSLEERIFEIRQQRGDIITEINNIEQEYILAHMFSSSQTDESERSDSLETTKPLVRYRSLYKNDIFTSALAPEDYADLVVAQAEDESIEADCMEYIKNYKQLDSTVKQYLETDDESVADSLFSLYLELKHKAEVRNNEIDIKWNHIIDTKYYALGYVLEKSNRYDALDASSEAFSETQQQCSQLDGEYASDALMHYATSRTTLLNYEIATAQEFGLVDAIDSLQQRLGRLTPIEYRHKKIELERRLFLDYAPIIIGRTNFYNNTTNKLPELKVYERGTIYRILLGAFKTKQTMTLFKGVQPLYIAKNDKGRYCYYAGGFATLAEAEEAQLFLKEKGFKRPEICRWRDGEMVNLSEVKEEKGQESVADIENRYLVAIECEELSDDMRELINTTTPDKMISRRGAQFAIGTFTERSEADLLMSTLMDKYPDIAVSIIVLDMPKEE